MKLFKGKGPFILVFIPLFTVLVSLVSVVVLEMIEKGIHFFWTTLPQALFGFAPTPLWWTLLIPVIGGLMAGVVLRHFGDHGPEQFNDAMETLSKTGRIEYKYLPGALLVSFASLWGGASLGPEALLTAVIGGFATWVGDKTQLIKQRAMVLIASGMSSFFGSFFASPLVIILIFLESSHKKGKVLLALLIPLTIAGLVSTAIFIWSGHILLEAYQLPDYQFNFTQIPVAVLLGIVGFFPGALFVLTKSFFNRVFATLRQNRPVLTATFGGLMFGAIALFFPLTLFSGDTQLQTVIDQTVGTSALLLALLALAKLVSSTLCLGTGLKGGQIFPAMFVGGAFGLAVYALFPTLPMAMVFACVMVASTTVILKVPITAVLLLGILTEWSLLPVMMIAAFTTQFIMRLVPLDLLQPSSVAQMVAKVKART